MSFTIWPGAPIVGEIALLSNRPRSATVRAVRYSELLLLRVSSFHSLVEQTRRYFVR